jgi:hypothetical protein
MLKHLRLAALGLLGQWLEDAHDIAQEQLSDETYTSPEDFLKDVNTHQEQIEAIQVLKQQLEEERD